MRLINWWAGEGLNLRPLGYRPSALPTELPAFGIGGGGRIRTDVMRVMDPPLVPILQSTPLMSHYTKGAAPSIKFCNTLTASSVFLWAARVSAGRYRLSTICITT